MHRSRVFDSRLRDNKILFCLFVLSYIGEICACELFLVAAVQFLGEPRLRRLSENLKRGMGVEQRRVPPFSLALSRSARIWGFSIFMNDIRSDKRRGGSMQAYTFTQRFCGEFAILEDPFSIPNLNL